LRVSAARPTEPDLLDLDLLNLLDLDLLNLQDLDLDLLNLLDLDLLNLLDLDLLNLQDLAPAAPLGLVSGCSAAAAALHRTRRALGTDTSVRALASQLGWVMRRSRVAQE
jgi:hypothetical protein